MSFKNIFVSTLKYLILTVLFLIFYIMSTGMMASPSMAAKAPEGDAVMWGLLVIAAVDTAVMSFLIVRSRLHGWRLMLAILVSVYGVMSIMSQIETIWFAGPLGIPASDIPFLFLMTLPALVVFTPIAVLVWGKARRSEEAPEKLQINGWLWKMPLIAVVYLILYFTFGSLVAWSNPDLVAMYDGGTDPTAFNNWLYVLQIVRGMLWAVFALPVIYNHKGSRLEVAIAVGLLLALPMNIPHVLPNPYMPLASVRLSHFIETATSNFLFGMALTYILGYKSRLGRKLAPAVQEA